MKLLIITAIKEFEKDVLKILKKGEIKTFTFKEVKGFKDLSEEAMESNWFASEMNINESILFYAFVKKENVETVFELVKTFNDQQESMSHIHLASLNIEKSN